MAPDNQPNPDKEPSTGKPEASGLGKLWQELRRRHVVRVAIVYAVVAWLVIQVAATTFGSFGIPEWAFRFVVLMVILGFPLSLVVAWAFELTPEGIKTTKTARVTHPESHKDESHSKKRHWFSLGLAAAVPTLIFGVLALFFYIRSGDVTQVSDGEKSIAVLPFSNMSPDEENAFFADGVHEDVLTNLAQIRDLLVISRTSTLRYRGSMKDLSEIGRELGVRYLVEGSVRRAGNRVRVTAQLIDANVDQHIWAQNYTRDLDDIFAIQAEIAQEIAGKLQAALSPEEVTSIERRPTENQEAYDFYLKGRQFGAQISNLEKSVALDPGFAEAWAGLAAQLIRQWNTQSRVDASNRERAHEALNQAKRLGPDLPEVLLAENLFARHEYYDYTKSIDHLLKALAINPGYFQAQRNLAARYAQLGRLAESQLHYEAVLRLEPNYSFAVSQLATVYMQRGMWEKANELLNSRTDQERTKGSQYLRALFKYLHEGDKSSLLESDWQSIADEEFFPVNYTPNRALIARNLEEALRLIEDFESNNEFSLITGIGETTFHFITLPLLQALLWFELNNEEKWLEEAEKAHMHLQRLSREFLEGDPRYQSNLMISHALKGERNPIDSLAAKVRKKTRMPNWQFARQVQCEMHIAIAYLVLGDHDKAIETLEAASKMDGPIFLNRELDLWFIFDRLRGDPRFDALLKD
jgi:TolB-like protein